MANALDLTVLREITAGDKDLERGLFEMFISSSDKCLSILQQQADNVDGSEWRTQAHAWKGSCANLGASRLRDLCFKAQTSESSPAAFKHQLLDEIKQEYAVVLQDLATEMATA